LRLFFFIDIDYLDVLSRNYNSNAPAPYSAVLFAEWFPKLEKVKEEIKNAMYVKS
jgi:pyruvate dehydrogenase E1 component beta subunit